MYSIVISANVRHVEDSVLREYSIAARECRAEDELPRANFSLFTRYTRELCVYECALANTAKNFDCVPCGILFR